MKRSAMPARTTALARTGTLRRTPFKASSTLTRTKPARTATIRVGKYRRTVPVKSWATVLVRAGGKCEMMLDGCKIVATDPSHRVARGMGGRRTPVAFAESGRPCNILAACRACHEWATRNPAESYDLGLTLRTGMNPAIEPACRRGHLVILRDDGTLAEYDPTCPPMILSIVDEAA